MHANQDLVNFAINRLRDGRTPGQIKKEMHKANLGWHGFEISRAIAAAIKETETVTNETMLVEVAPSQVHASNDVETALEKIDNSENVDNQQTPAFHNISIDWPLLDVTNAWGLLTAAAIVLIILTALAAVYLSI